MKTLISTISYKVFVALLIAILALAVLLVKPVYAATCNSTGTGNWNTAGTWSCGHVPTSSDDVSIGATHTISFNPTSGTVLSLTVSGTLRFDNTSNNSLTVSGNVTNTGTIAVINQTGTNAHTLNVGGDFTNNGTFTSSSTNDSLNVGMNGTAAQNIGGTTATVFNNLTISNTSAAVTAMHNFSIGGTMMVNNGATFNAGTYVISGGGTFTLAAGGTLGIGSTAGISATGASGNIQTSNRNFNAGAKYVYNGAANQNTGTGLPNNLTGTLTIENSGNTVTLSNGRTIANGGTLNIVTGTFAAGTNLTMASTSSITRSGGSMTGTPQGTGAYNVTYTGQTMSASSELSGSGLNNVTVNLNSFEELDLTANVVPHGNLSVTSGDLVLGIFTINRSAAGGTFLLAAGSRLYVYGPNNFPANYNTVILNSSSVVLYVSLGDQTISSQTYGDLIFGGSGLKSVGTSFSVSNFSIAPTGTAKASLVNGVNITTSTLTLGGLGTNSGTWGSTTSAAANKTNTYFNNAINPSGIVTVTTDSRPTPTISGVTASQTITYGTATITLSGTVSPAGPVYPAIGEMVGVTIDGVLQNTTITTSTGGFTINYNTSSIPYSATAYTITYSYSGGTNLRAAANNTSTSLTVNRATSSITVTCPGTAQTYTGAALTPCTASYSTSDGLSGPLTPIYSNNVNVGTAAANATYAGDANHESSSNSATFTISQATSSVTVTCPVTTQPYTGSAQTPCTASYSTSDGLGDSLTPTYSNNTNIGTATADATYAGDANHASSNNSATFTIGRATSSVTVTCPATTQAYTGSALTPCTASYSTSDGLSGSLTPTYSNNTNVGTATADATYAGDANHASSSNSATFTISQAISSVIVTCPATPQTYTGSAQTPCTASYLTSDGLSGSLIPTYSNNTNVGTATADATYAGDANHASSSNSATFTIGQAGLTITASSSLMPFGGPIPTITPIYTGLQGDDTAPSAPPTCSTTATTTSPAGTLYPSTCSGAADPNYSISYVDGTVNVVAAGQTITITQHAPTSAISGSTFSVAANATSGLSVDITTTGACSGSGSGSATIQMTNTVGTCTVHYNQTGDSNYDAAPEKTEDVATLAITSANNATFTVGTAGTFTVTTNGTPAPALTETTGTLPAWLTFTDNGDGTRTLSGTPPTGSMGTYPFVFKASNGTADDVTQNFTLTVSGGPVIATNGVNTTPDTGDGQLAEFEVVTVGVTKFTVTFNQDLINAPSTDSNYSESVTNPANYMLVNDNGDGFQTTDCSSGISSQDFAISIDSVAYSNNGGAGPFVATLSINGGSPLSDGNYRLYACGTTSITNLGGLKLAGDGKNEGTDFIRNFIIRLPSGRGGGSGSSVSYIPITGGNIPVTGFTPGQTTFLPVQPAAKDYSSISGLRLEIPVLGINVPIVGVDRKNGTWNLTWLENNAGYLDGSAFPTWVGNTVLTGHVVDATGAPGPFAYIKDLQIGDKVYIHFGGLVYIYEVRENRTVLPTDLTTIFRHENYNWATLVTCEDYNNHTKTYDNRRMARAVLVSVIPEK